MIHTCNFIWNGHGWETSGEELPKAQLLLVFGDRIKMEQGSGFFDSLRTKYPGAHIVSVSTSGEILGQNVFDESIVATALSFDHTGLRVYNTRVSDAGESQEAGQRIMEELMADDLSGVLLFSDGQGVNGSELVEGVYAPLRRNGRAIPVSGGLAGDGTRFQRTLVGYNTPPKPNQIVAIGLYGDRIKIGNGSMGGWDAFGVERVVTKSDKNKLYELDGKNALQLYKAYLGDLASELPSSALLFPLQLLLDGKEKRVVRTVLSIDEGEQSMTFAGNLPEGSRVQLMKANFDRLIDGANISALNALSTIASEAQFALLVSCVGRKMVLGQRVEEEVEEAIHVLGPHCTVSGFYSYGEICPLHDVNESCELHNQTMTISTFSES